MVTRFQDRVYCLVRKIPKGKVTTYREIAKKLRTRAYRAVGQALSRNPFAPQVPCHRVVNSDGSIGGYKGRPNSKEKARMLREEGIAVKGNKVNLKKCLFTF
jgi:methylated-DNA-[protein]-cysteine S-methyltransferase